MAKVKKQQENTQKRVVFTTELIEKVTQDINNGIVYKGANNPWYNSKEIGVRREGVVFRASEEETAEYLKCAVDVKYFSETYCKVKREDGTIGNITLRDYQEEMLESMDVNRYNIFMCSRQMGKTISSSIYILHYLLFNNDKNAMIIANVKATVVEIVDKIKSIYELLPFFLKPGVKVWNQSSITFENGCRIKTAARTKTPAVGFTIDLLYLDEFAHIPSNIIEPFYTAAYPTVSAVSNSKIIITSTPNGMNLFYRLLTEAEAGRNNFNPMRVYWYQMKGRFVTYIRLNEDLVEEYGLDVFDLEEYVKNYWNGVTDVEMKYNYDLEKYVISVYNNELCTDEMVKSMTIKDRIGKTLPFRDFAEISTWKEDAIKDIGGEAAFNQEYDLRFINSSNSLLSESMMSNLLDSRTEFQWREIPEFDKKLSFYYKGLTWTTDEDIFNEEFRKKYKIIISVDLAEGLGQDYSVINIFKVDVKDYDIIEKFRHRFTRLNDFFKLEQIGIFRSNVLSVKQIAEILYLIGFEYFDPDNTRIVLELNGYGNALLAEMPHVFEQKNNYGSFIFVKYRHRVDSTETKIGLKVGENKNLLVKDFQDLMEIHSISLTHSETITELSTFTKQISPSGNVRYAADVGNDDCVMTCVNVGSVFNRPFFKSVCEELLDTIGQEYRDIIQELAGVASSKKAGLSYGAFSGIKNKMLKR